jgi:hypothetical protein
METHWSQSLCPNDETSQNICEEAHRATAICRVSIVRPLVLAFAHYLEIQTLQSDAYVGKCNEWLA